MKILILGFLASLSSFSADISGFKNTSNTVTMNLQEASKNLKFKLGQVKDQTPVDKTMKMQFFDSSYSVDGKACKVQFATSNTDTKSIEVSKNIPMQGWDVKRTNYDDTTKGSLIIAHQQLGEIFYIARIACPPELSDTKKLEGLFVFNAKKIPAKLPPSGPPPTVPKNNSSGAR